MPDSNIQNSHAHFVPLSVIMYQHAGRLLDYMQEHKARNVVITLQVKIDIAGRRKSPFSLLSALFDFETKRLSMCPAPMPACHDCLYLGARASFRQ